MTTPHCLGSASSQAASAASYGGGAQSVGITYTESDLTSLVAGARYAVLVVGYDIVEPAATTAPTVTVTPGWTLLAEHSSDVAFGADQRRDYLAAYGAPLTSFPLTVTWAFTNTNFTGRVNSFVVGYTRSSPIAVSAPDLDGTIVTDPTSGGTIGAPARPATDIQVTLTTAGTNPLIDTANGFTSQRTDGGAPSLILLDQEDVTGSESYALINTGDVGAQWITVGCALRSAGGCRGLGLVRGIRG